MSGLSAVVESVLAEHVLPDAATRAHVAQAVTAAVLEMLASEDVREAAGSAICRAKRLGVPSRHPSHKVRDHGVVMRGVPDAA